MGQAYPIDNFLRPPYEFIPAAASTAAAVGMLVRPELFMLSPSVSVAGASAFALHALWRGRQAWRLLRRQRNLSRLSRYELAASEIPRRPDGLFLGMGFEWSAVHTQRPHLVQEPEHQHYARPSRLNKLVQRWHPQSGLQSRLADWLSRDAWWNPFAPLPPVGGNPVLHGVELDEEQVWMAIGERVGHMGVYGTTRVGKTRFAEVVIVQDIARGDVVIVFDPKGDVALLKRAYVEARRADRQFYMFHLGYPEVSARYSPVGNFGRITEVATRIAGQLPGEGQSAAFREFVWRFVNVIARAVSALGERPSYEQIYRDAVNIDSLCKRYFTFWLDRHRANWRDEIAEVALEKKQIELAHRAARDLEAIQMMEFMRRKGLADPIADALQSVLSNDRSYFEKLVSSLYPLLEKLTTGKMAELLSPDYDDPHDPRPIFDWMKVINQRAVVYVGLDSLSDFEVAAAVGNAMFADLASTAGKLYKHGATHGQSRHPAMPKISIHADEFNELIGDEFVPLLNKAGGAGFQVTVYTQTRSDVEAKIGSEAKAGQIEGNLNTIVMLRVRDNKTAELLTEQLPQVRVHSIMNASAVTDSADPTDSASFVSRNEDRISSETVPMLEPADLVRLPKGQAFALIEGGRLVKLRMPLPSAEGDGQLPDSLRQMADEMARKYAVHLQRTEAEAATVAGLGSDF